MKKIIFLPLFCFFIFQFSQGALAQKANIAIIKATQFSEKRPELNQAAEIFCNDIARRLRESKLDFSILEDTSIRHGTLNHFQLAIFPFNNTQDELTTNEILQYVHKGGRIIWFGSFPKQLSRILGVAKYRYRDKALKGRLKIMLFSNTESIGFPKMVHQEADLYRIIEALGSNGRALAYWFDAYGNNSTIPAVIVSPHAVFISDYFSGRANDFEQTHLLISSIGCLVPTLLGSPVYHFIERASILLNEIDKDKVSRTSVKQKFLEIKKYIYSSLEARIANQWERAFHFAVLAFLNAQFARAAVYPSKNDRLRGVIVHTTDNTDWEGLIRALKQAHFNAVFPAMGDASSTKYPSAFAPQVTKKDLMLECMKAARKYGIQVFVWRCNFQAPGKKNGQRKAFFKAGRMVLSLEQALGKPEKNRHKWSTRWLDPSDERNQRLEYNMLLEIVKKYHPDGILFDYLRLPGSHYCYCKRCKKKFETWLGRNVKNWPQDCAHGGKLEGKYIKWRASLISSVVKEITSGIKKVAPGIVFALAARSNKKNAFGNDAQDWVNWAKNGYLDMICPMDYTPSKDVLVKNIEDQIKAVGDSAPVYPILGVGPKWADSPVELSEQIVAARRAGVQGFLLFPDSPLLRQILQALREGTTRMKIRETKIPMQSNETDLST